jgi:ATP-binding cassette subfamily C protein
VESVRDTYASVIAALRGFAIALVATSVGALSVAPAIAALIIPPFVVGAGAFLTTLGFAAARQRACVLAEESMADVAGRVLAGTRDIVALGAHEHATKLVAGPITRHAMAERSLLRVTALTTICFTVGVWIPLIVLLAAGPWLVSRGLTAGAIMGGLTYVLFGLQPALSQLISGVGGNGLRFVVTLGNILRTSATPTIPVQRTAVLAGHAVALRDITFAYGPHSEPVIRDLDLTIPEGDHLAIVGPSGTGKSTLANILCGLLRPDSGTAMSGGARVADLSAEQLAAVRVLIPQEAFVFTGTIWENITYLRPTASAAEVAHAIATVGADTLVERLGGVSAPLRPRELSGGEKQLVALVRAYLSTAPAVILDEATCHLDPAAERRAEQAFAERGGTLIVVAHRISSAVRARRILILDGPHATVGDHAGLLRTSALYRDLVGLWEAAGSPEPSTRTPVTAAGSPE